MSGIRNVRLGEMATGRATGALTVLGLGSCVAAMLWDPESRVGGMAHVLLPAPPPGDRQKQPPGRYAQTAIPRLLDEMLSLGAARATIVARLAGGAAMFTNLMAPGLIHTGERNVLAARAALHALGVPVSAEWVGGDFGRTVELDLATGRITARSVRHGERDL